MDKKTYYLNILKICLTIENKIDILKCYKNLECVKDREILDECNSCLTDMFCKYGVNDNDEPNDCGYILEEIIDYINNLIYGLEKMT